MMLVVIVIMVWKLIGVNAMEGEGEAATLGVECGEQAAVAVVIAAKVAWEAIGIRGTQKRRKRTSVATRAGNAEADPATDTEGSEEEGDAVESTEAARGVQMRRESALKKDCEWAGDRVLGSKKWGDMVFCFMNCMRIKEGPQAETPASRPRCAR